MAQLSADSQLIRDYFVGSKRDALRSVDAGFLANPRRRSVRLKGVGRDGTEKRAMTSQYRVNPEQIDRQSRSSILKGRLISSATKKTIQEKRDQRDAEKRPTQGIYNSLVDRLTERYGDQAEETKVTDRQLLSLLIKKGQNIAFPSADSANIKLDAKVGKKTFTQQEKEDMYDDAKQRNQNLPEDMPDDWNPSFETQGRPLLTYDEANTEDKECEYGTVRDGDRVRCIKFPDHDPRRTLYRELGGKGDVPTNWGKDRSGKNAANIRGGKAYDHNVRDPATREALIGRLGAVRGAERQNELPDDDPDFLAMLEDLVND